LAWWQQLAVARNRRKYRRFSGEFHKSESAISNVSTAVFFFDMMPAMITRRDALGAFALFAELIASARDVDAQPQPPASPPAAPRPPVFKHDLPNLTMDDWEVTVSHVDYPPGRVGPAHRHPGFVLAYVLEGTVVTKISGQGEEKTCTVGQMFYEQPGATHEVSRNASQTQPAKLLAMIFAKKGSTLTTPVPGDNPL
jgi:quercetin dioxygenase-like cupin family protein